MGPLGSTVMLVFQHPCPGIRAPFGSCLDPSCVRFPNSVPQVFLLFATSGLGVPGPGSFTCCNVLDNSGMEMPTKVSIAGFAVLLKTSIANPRPSVPCKYLHIPGRYIRLPMRTSVCVAFALEPFLDFKCRGMMSRQLANTTCAMRLPLSNKPPCMQPKSWQHAAWCWVSKCLTRQCATSQQHTVESTLQSQRTGATKQYGQPGCLAYHLS